MLQFLVDDNIVPEQVLPINDFAFDDEILFSAIKRGSDLFYDPIDDSLYYFLEDGSKNYCPDLSKGMSFSSDWISDHLPEVFIDIGRKCKEEC
jgi:hypothetical protein